MKDKKKSLHRLAADISELIQWYESEYKAKISTIELRDGRVYLAALSKNGILSWDNNI